MTQLQEGAQADVFASANAVQMQRRAPTPDSLLASRLPFVGNRLDWW